MVIGDDQVHARTAGALSRGKGASADINTDNQTNAGGSSALDHVSAKIVTFANSVWDMEVGSAVAQLNCRFQNHNRGCAINVVVSINQNSFFVLDRGVQPLDGGFHAGHKVGRV